MLGSRDTTRKFLFRFTDESLIETVLIPASPALYGSRSDRRTICVSTQVGCAYGCKFCASGLEGFSRNLQPNEIVDQIIAIERETGEKIDNIVFMGMGEPLANLENVMRAIRIINAPWGLGIGARHITVSTSGLAPQIRKLGRRATSNPPRHFLARRHRRSAQPNHADQPPLQSRNAAGGVRLLRQHTRNNG